MVSLISQKIDIHRTKAIKVHGRLTKFMCKPSFQEYTFLVCRKGCLLSALNRVALADLGLRMLCACARCVHALFVLVKQPVPKLC